MYRLSILLALGLFVGCRMAGSQYDYCVPAYTSHEEDYRGCDPMYRAGSVFLGNAITSDDEEGIADLSQNAGNFGQTTWIDKTKPTKASNLKKPPKPKTDIKDFEDLLPETTPIGIPTSTPGPNGNGVPEIKDRPFDEQIPTLPGPVQAPPRAPTTSHYGRGSGISGSSALEQRLDGSATITVEELKRLDPSITDVRILNVEDRLAQ